MSETVIGLFPDSHEAQEFVPMLTNRGYGREDVDVIGGQGWATSETGSDLIDKLSQLGLADAERAAYVDAVGHGGTVIAARASDGRRAEQLLELMQEHGATRCTHAAA
jgi:hypothetical protein